MHFQRQHVVVTMHDFDCYLQESAMFFCGMLKLQEGTVARPLIQSLQETCHFASSVIVLLFLRFVDAGLIC